MADNFLGEIRIVGFNFPPMGWAFCDGQLLAITQYTALFSLLGTQFGGNGTTTFALPNLQGCVAINAGVGPGLTVRTVGDSGGQETHILASSEIPAHTHTMVAGSAVGTVAGPAGQTPGASPPEVGKIYGTTKSANLMSPNMVHQTGGSQPHENRMPTLTLNCVIALQGIFPARS